MDETPPPPGPLERLARRPAPVFAILVGLCTLLFFYRLGERELTSSHEARAAQNAQTILDGGDWLLPRLFDRRAELQKPPLYYWLVAALAYVRGDDVDAFLVRLPAALSALATVLLLYVLAAARGRPLAGFLAALVLATSQHFTWLARVARIDMPLTLTVTLALGAGYVAVCRLREGRTAKGWLLAAYLATAAGLLLKGPVAVVLPLCAAACWRLLAREPLPLRKLGLAWGVPLVLAVAAPWYVAAGLRTDGELFRVFFWYHNVQRGLGGGEGLASHPWWFYAPRLAADLLPWCLLLPAAGWWAWRCRDREGRFGLAWLAGMLFFLSLMSFKRADYLLPAYPGAALLIGCALERVVQQWRIPVTLGAPAAVAFVTWVAGLGLLTPALDRDAHERLLAEEIRRRTSSHVILFRAEAHCLSFHTGRPVHTVLEWENLDVWAGKPAPTYVVMSPEYARDAPRHLTAGRLVEVLRTTDLTPAHKRPLVLLRTEPHRRAGAVRGAGR